MRTRARLVVLPVLTLLTGPLVGLATTAPASAAVTVVPVPTSNAGLGRITTAPDGSLWFLEENANRVGRISPSGQLQEFPLPPVDSSVEGPAVDLDVSPNGQVWVTTDFGRTVTRLDAAGNVLGQTGLGAYPYGGEVRVDPTGVAWITMNYDESYVVRVQPNGTGSITPNAPECDDILGEAPDGSMWCLSDVGLNTLVHLGPDANSGVNYPLPDDATYPQGLAAGPVGSIWFTRNDGGTIFTSPNDGEIGYVDQGSFQTTLWDTGSRTAPQDLVMGPDRNMWFTNAGAEPAIGHISADGVGHITKVGNFEPTSLTFAPDGALWFTDATNNVVVRVTTDELQTTNIDVGEGATMRFGNTGTTGGTAAAGSVAKARKPVAVKRQRVPVRVTCPASATTGCTGTLALQTAKKVAKPGKKGKKGTKARVSVAKPRTYTIAAGRRATVKVRLTRQGARLVPPRRVTGLRVSLTPQGGTSPTATRVLRVRR